MRCVRFVISAKVAHLKRIFGLETHNRPDLSTIQHKLFIWMFKAWVCRWLMCQKLMSHSNNAGNKTWLITTLWPESLVHISRSLAEYLGFNVWLLSSVTARLLTSIPGKRKTGSRYWIRTNKWTEQITWDFAAPLKSKMERAADLRHLLQHQTKITSLITTAVVTQQK